MIVILNRDVKGTGKAGEIVKVSDGYARNMLLPKGYATEATEGNVRNLEKQKALMEQKRAEDKAAAQKTAEKLAEAKIVIKTKSGEGGRLFGSITSKDIADAVKEQLQISLDKKKIQMNNPIKNIGTFTVDVKLYSEVTGQLTVEVTD